MDSEELLDNLRKDREKLSLIRDKVLSGSLDKDTDLYSAGRAAEKLAIVTDTLTKLNSQMFEIMKEDEKNKRSTESIFSGDIFEEIKNADSSTVDGEIVSKQSQLKLEEQAGLKVD